VEVEPQLGRGSDWPSSANYYFTGQAAVPDFCKHPHLPHLLHLATSPPLPTKDPGVYLSFLLLSSSKRKEKRREGGACVFVGSEVGKVVKWTPKLGLDGGWGGW
jgi:hypothetical protein